MLRMYAEFNKHKTKKPSQTKSTQKTYEKESILRTLGATGMSINNEFEKKEIRLLASRFDGTSIADSFTVSKRSSRLICRNVPNLTGKYFVFHLYLFMNFWEGGEGSDE